MGPKYMSDSILDVPVIVMHCLSIQHIVVRKQLNKIGLVQLMLAAFVASIEQSFPDNCKSAGGLCPSSVPCR